MKKGEIYLVNFEPSTGLEMKKVRPAVVLQSDKISSNLITVMPISSKVKNKISGDILIKKNKTNRLFSDSVIKTKQISSFDQKRFIHFIVQVNQAELARIDIYLKKHFALI